MTDEELEFLLFGSIDEVGLPETESEENDFIELAESKSWLPSVSASVGFGVSDNPMYGPYVRESSTYMEFETESFLLRQANPDYLSYFYFYGEGKRFLEVDDHKLTGILLVQGEHSYRPKNSPRFRGCLNSGTLTTIRLLIFLTWVFRSPCRYNQINQK